jgi:DNA (cytosine-5)-methyltransferase 1
VTYGSICSGIEAPGLAWEPLGMKPLWFSEIEKFPSAVLKHHWADVKNLGDFTAPESWQYMIDHPPDILFGGTPCQAFSVAGQRQSLEDDRGNLTLMFARLWNELRAVGTRYAVWENVPGVLNTPDNAFGGFLSGMVGERHPLTTHGGRWTNAGMVSGPEGVAAWTVKDAQHFGVPQRRRRVFAVIGHPGDFSPSEILFKPESVSGDIAKGEETGEDATPPAGAGINTWQSGPLAARDYKDCGTDSVNPNTAKLALQYSDVAITDMRGNGDGNLCCTLTGDHLNRPTDYTPLVREAIPNSGNWNAVATDAMVVRRLTPVECERLMGMPDNWTQIPWRGKEAKECPDGLRYKAIGNSIAVPCLRWIGERIISQ